MYAKLGAPIEYDYTVLTTWDLSTQTLSVEARSPQILLAFFDPDSVPERLISETKAELEGTEHAFLLDEFEYVPLTSITFDPLGSSLTILPNRFGDAIMELTRTSMINRLSASKSVSMHRLVQFAVLSRLSPGSRAIYFDLAVNILYFDFPNTWFDRGAHQGHGWGAWETCSAVLPHVSQLMELHKYDIKETRPDLWAELIFRTGA